jgi:hypothetical protein
MTDMRAFDDDLLLAEALERTLVQRGSTAGGTPELTGLLTLARTLEASARGVAPSAEFRAAARERLVRRMGPVVSASRLGVAPVVSASPLRAPWVAGQPRRGLRPVVDRIALWSARLAAGIATLSLAGAAAVNASASALPGEPLYAIKQAGEALAVQAAYGDEARQQVLLRQADTRLDETAWLLEQGRDTEAAATALRYDEAVDRAAAASPPAEAMETTLQVDRARLTELLQRAPLPARGGLERALTATERGLARAKAARGAEPAAPSEPPQPRPPEKIQPAGGAVELDGDEAPAAVASDDQIDVRQRRQAEGEAHAAPVGAEHAAASSEAHQAEIDERRQVAVDDGEVGSRGTSQAVATPRASGADALRGANPPPGNKPPDPRAPRNPPVPRGRP